MAIQTPETTALAGEVRELSRQLAEANNIIDAIRAGEVDALLLAGGSGDDVYVLKGTDRIYRAIVEEMQEGYVTLASDGTVLFCNKNICAIVGRPQENLIGSSIYSLIAKRQDVGLIKSCLSHPQKGLKAEITLLAADGSRIPVLVAAGGITVDEATYSCLVITDLSEQKRNERMARLIFDQSTEALIACGNTGLIIRANAAAKALLGGDIVGSDFDGLVRLYDERAGCFFRLGSVTGPDSIRRREVSFEARDGKHYHLLLSAGRLSDAGETALYGYIVTLANITEIKKYTAEITRLDRLNLIGEMAAGIGHEVRNPLTTVRGYLQMFRDKAYIPRSPDTLDIMIDELDRANTIISEFLALAKNKTVKMKPTKLNRVIEAIFPLIQADAFRRGSEVRLETSPVPAISADEREMRQCILNLVRNGLEAMPAGGTVTISTSYAYDCVTMAVRDQGSGIAPHVKEKLGTPFYSTKENGTGLGLPVCYSIANRHGAKIECDTSPAGTTFSLIFPLLKPPAAMGL